MKKIFIVAGILFLAAACNKNAPKPQSSQPASQPTSQGSFKDMLAMGKSQKCETSFKQDEKTESKGTMYLANGKMRGDFSIQVEGKTAQSHLIVKDQAVYSWAEGMGVNMAFKMPMNQPNQTASGSGKVNLEQKVNYSCQNWSEDDSEFALPVGVNFQDTVKMMQGTQPSNSGSQQNAAACEACNSAPASSKAQCLAALGCK